MKNRGRIALVLIPVLVLAAGGGAAFYFLRVRHVSKPVEKEFALALTDLTVNLADGGQPHHLSASLSLTLRGADPEKAAPECDPPIRDAALIVMSQCRYSELLSAEGKEALKGRILEAVNANLAERKLRVTDVLFTTFLMD